MAIEDVHLFLCSEPGVGRTVRFKRVKTFEDLEKVAFTAFKYDRIATDVTFHLTHDACGLSIWDIPYEEGDYNMPKLTPDDVLQLRVHFAPKRTQSITRTVEATLSAIEDRLDARTPHTIQSNRRRDVIGHEVGNDEQPSENGMSEGNSDRTPDQDFNAGDAGSAYTREPTADSNTDASSYGDSDTMDDDESAFSERDIATPTSNTDKQKRKSCQRKP
ncbi:hypothetical protein BDV96DRAFT_604392 [Lophiotrema nucula]|uniref:Uncharacterized protein n=1 Tax=Lophiotrema nucula TaxID=690887 RepID=A0A6A5YV02_9PLEO|nr:hypothetical protein BDV96DRAFT_604392 [Lophiotrema nucula]